MTTKRNYVECRHDLANYFRNMLIGPAGGAEEEFPLIELPADRYIMGVLFPHNMPAESIVSKEDDTLTASDADDLPDSPLSMTFQKLPASAGLSFFVKGDSDIECEVSGASYKIMDSEVIFEIETNDNQERKKNKRQVWKRVPVRENQNSQKLKLKKISTKQEIRETVLDGMAELHVIWRSMGDGFLITATLLNAEEAEKSDVINKGDIQKSIFQAGLRCRPLSGVIDEYPAGNRFSHDLEEEELALQYSDRKTYAVGHGCAAFWEQKKGASPEYVAIEFMPSVEVKPVTTKLEAKEGKDVSEVLRLQYLADETVSSDELKSRLDGFVDQYESWVGELDKQEIATVYKGAKGRIIDRIVKALERIRSGVDCITGDSLIRKTFAMANRAMLMQMVHSGREFGGGFRDKNEKTFEAPDYGSPDYHSFAWRPFQLAFQLLTVKSIVERECDERETVDLIWFPTGGGKTEAYLALSAFEMFYRRLKYGEEGGGTAVIMRYTLRLLTTQQFERAATLICAMEQIRHDMTGEMGDEPFTLGLWVGGTSSPNRYTSDSKYDIGAFEMYEKILEQDRPENSFQLQRCPWCGTRIVPRHRMDEREYYGLMATQTSFMFYCPTSSCVFHETIPLSVVDEHLFENPPTMLIGTIDKFARLAWDNRACVFFGHGGTTDRQPPSLIIQDELHLISGPLGTIAGVYESAIDSVIEVLGLRPKVIAATATIRRADEQVQKLYGRPVSVFPPPGLSYDNSYFARTDFDSPGRLYMGVMGQGHTPVTSLVRTSAVLSQSVFEVELPEEAVDTWWTQVIYHNSRRELGKTMTLARDDIPARINAIALDESKMRSLPNVEELSANIPGARIPEVLKVLGTSLPAKDVIDILPCTNMISVGVDISRLGLMLINGQPKTTAEYIQASSRIGRDQKRPPGVVVTLYTGTKPRDRSHYENFVSYHNRLYREVEPTSVTPFAPPARERALHAAVIILARLAGGLGENESAALFDPDDPKMNRLLELIKQRMSRSEPEESDAISEAVETVIEEWQERIRISSSSGKPLRYYNKGGKQFASLLCHFSDKQSDCWPTLNSMRHVDQESVVNVFGEDFTR